MTTVNLTIMYCEKHDEMTLHAGDGCPSEVCEHAVQVGAAVVKKEHWQALKKELDDMDAGIV